MRVLVIEDDKNIRDNLSLILDENGYEVQTAVKQSEIITQLNRVDANGKDFFDLYLVDVMLPDCNGFDVCMQIRKVSQNPIIFLTCCDDEDSITKGLDLGADDYMVKPFRSAELLSRIRAIFRRTQRAAENEQTNHDVKVYGELRIDLKNRKVMKYQKEIRLTPIEFQLLERLICNSGSIVKRESFFMNLWDDHGNYVENNTLTVAISRLKNKLGTAQKLGKPYIETIYGVGYRWIGGEEH